MSKTPYEDFKEKIEWDRQIYQKESKRISGNTKKSSSRKIEKTENKIGKAQSHWLKMQIKSFEVKKILTKVNHQ